MKKKTGTSSLSETQRKEIIEMASRVAIEQYHKEADRTRKEVKDKRLHNTEMLMEKYRSFIIHSQNAVFNASQVENDLDLETLLSLMDCSGKNKQLTVDSVRESVARTRMLVDHINNMLEYFELRSMKSSKPEDARRFRVIKALYIDEVEKTPQEIADDENVDLSTVYRDKRAALRQLSALIFGYVD